MLIANEVNNYFLPIHPRKSVYVYTLKVNRSLELNVEMLRI